MYPQELRFQSPTKPNKAQQSQVKLIDEDINHSHRIGNADVVVKAFR